MKMNVQGRWVTGIRRKFKPEFHDKIRAGVKRSTIRGKPLKELRDAKPFADVDAGDLLILEAWSGKPYASKVDVIGYADVEAVRKVSIMTGRWGIEVHIETDPAGQAWQAIVLTPGDEEAEKLAAIEGFDSVDALAKFFEDQTPFSGVQILWQNFRLHP